MPRKEPAQGKHTSPDKLKDIDPSDYTKDKDEDGLLDKLIEGFEIGQKNAGKEYKGLWTEDEFRQAVIDYFHFCASKVLKPNKAGLRTWLAVSRSQYHAWETQPEKYSYKSDILALAHNLMEDSYVNRSEKYPTANIFLLKSAHGHVEASRLDITSDGKQLNDANEIKDLVTKLGLANKG